MAETLRKTEALEKTDSKEYQQRRYVGTKETVGYIMNHWSSSFNINDFKRRFIYDVLLIDFNYLAILDMVGGIWDVFNDTVIGVIIDRTRTRWGKFRPYLIGINVPLTLFSCLYWFLPFMFPNTAADYLPKFIVYFALSVLTETVSTFTSISNTGLLSTITPNPLERTRLITLGQLLAIGSNLPQILMRLFLDLVNNGNVNWHLSKLFLTFGLVTNIGSALAALFFFIVSKERVSQSIERPSVVQGIKSILTNKPILLITLADFLGGFAVGTSMTDYYIDVLGSSMLQTIVGIPGSVCTYASYAYLDAVRKRFSTKAIWIFYDVWGDFCWLGTCLFGITNKHFLQKKFMVPCMMIEEALEMCTYSFKKVIPLELYNEAMDYCEWKNGYRTEAMTGVARGLIVKLQNVVNNTVKSLIMGFIGYEQGRKVGTQDYKTKFWLFVLSTGFPIVTGALGIVPKFFYPLTAHKRDLMYNELAARREALAKAVTQNENINEITGE